MRRAGLLLIGLALCPLAHAAAPADINPPAAPVPAEDALKAGFGKLPEADRRAVQDALLWTGDFVGVVTGLYGPRTRDALTSFARKAALPPDFVLDPKARARLMAAGAAARAGVGFGPLKDKAAGVALSLPIKLLPRRTATDGGTHYGSPDGSFVADTLSRPMGAGGLAEVFDRMTVASASRKVVYKLLRPDFFVVSGEVGERKFYSRFVAGAVDGQSLVRGITLAYPKTEAARLDAVALAVAASFDAFPSSTPTPAETVPVPPPKPPAPPATFALTAIRIAPAAGLVHLPGRACVQPSLGGAPIALRRQDEASGLVLFDLPNADVVTPALSPESAGAGTAPLALFRREPDGLDVAPADVVGSGDAGAFTVSAGLQGRAEGSPIVDRHGRLLGLATEPRRLGASVAGTRLQNDYPVIGAATLKVFLDRAGLAAAPSPSSAPATLGAMAALWKPLVLKVVCQQSATAAP